MSDTPPASAIVAGQFYGRRYVTAIDGDTVTFIWPTTQMPGTMPLAEFAAWAAETAK